MSNLLTFTKDKWQISWRPVLHPSQKGRISNLDSTDPAKQTVNQGKLVGDTKLAQHLVPHEPTRWVSHEKLKLLSITESPLANLAARGAYLTPQAVHFAQNPMQPRKRLMGSFATKVSSSAEELSFYLRQTLPPAPLRARRSSPTVGLLWSPLAN